MLLHNLLSEAEPEKDENGIPYTAAKDPFKQEPFSPDDNAPEDAPKKAKDPLRYLDDLVKMMGPKLPEPKKKLKYDPMVPGSKRVLKNTDLQKIKDQMDKTASYYAQYKTLKGLTPPQELEQELKDLKWAYGDAIRQHYNTAKETVVSQKVIKVLEALNKKCSVAIKDMKSTNSALYRGTNAIGDMYFGKPTVNRRTITSSRRWQELYDKILAESGFKSLRSNSIFCTSDASFASGFGGSLYFIFPVNGFNFTWSSAPFNRDIVLGDSTFKKPKILNTKKILELLDNVTIYPAFVEAYVNENGYNDPEKYSVDNLPPHLWRSRVIDNQEYDYHFMSVWTIDRDLKLVSRLIADGMLPNLDTKFDDYISPEKFIESMELHHTDFDKALVSGHEITVNGNYFAIHYSHYQVIEDYLGIKVSDEVRYKNKANKTGLEKFVNRETSQ